MRGKVGILAALSMVVAGCVGAPQEDLSSASVVQPLPVDPSSVAHTLAGVAAVPEAFQSLRVRLALTGYNGAEPTIGVTSDGTIFATSSVPTASAAGRAATLHHQLVRSRDHGLTWEPVGDVVVGPKANLDPWMWVDPITNRVYNAPLYVVCTWASWSDDLGQTWTANPLTGCGPPAHDHQKLTTGPPPPGVTTMGYPNVVYYSYNSFRDEGTWISTSLDGGRTWSLGGVAHPSDCHAGVAGPVAVGIDGTAYSPKPACKGANVAVSRDGGRSWEVTGRIDDYGIQEPLAVNPHIATDSAGNAYLVYPGLDNLLYVSVSTDAGRTWSKPIRASPPQVTGTVFSVITAGEPGRVAIAYLGTDADTSRWGGNGHPPSPENADESTVWHFYLTMSENALDADPLFVSQRVTPEDDPVQIGCVWQSGGGNPCRNLLDFIGMTQHEGRPYVVFADGCDRCTSASESRLRRVTVAILEDGPGLLGGTLEALVGAVAP
ncbi:MAG TPA: sialidase family protein [Candidatus Thermoplasmatota archaeon]|nr:sialidase family protein [Candidatus Thermoplasmatota archaeon]